MWLITLQSVYICTHCILALCRRAVYFQSRKICMPVCKRWVGSSCLICTTPGRHLNVSLNGVSMETAHITMHLSHVEDWKGNGKGEGGVLRQVPSLNASVTVNTLSHPVFFQMVRIKSKTGNLYLETMCRFELINSSSSDLILTIQCNSVWVWHWQGLQFSMLLKLWLLWNQRPVWEISIAILISNWLHGWKKHSWDILGGIGNILLCLYFYYNILYICRVFTTVIRSLGDHFMPTHSPAHVTTTYIIEVILILLLIFSILL